MKNLIKVVSPELADKLVALGFQYIKEGSVYAFIETEELTDLLIKNYSNDEYIRENKLRF